MKNKKFLAVGLAVFGAVVFSSTMNIGNAETVKPSPAAIEMQLESQVAEHNVNKFTNFFEVDVYSPDSVPAGHITEVKYQGKVIGEIKRISIANETHNGKNLISSNLSAEETTKIFKELRQADGNNSNVTLSHLYKPGDNIATHIVRNIHKSGSYDITDVEKVLLATSNAFREETVAATADKADVLNKIQAARKQYIEVRTPTYNKPMVTQG